VSAIPLSILDLSPVPRSGDASEALANTLRLAQAAEHAGYHRYWVAEHHLAAGVASGAPAVLIAAIAAITSRIRVGSGAVQLAHSTPLVVAEQFGTLAHLHPGRIDLGLGRSGLRALAERIAASKKRQAAGEPARADARLVDGLLIPAPPARFTVDPVRLSAHANLLGEPEGGALPDYAQSVDDILAFFRGDYHAQDGTPFRTVVAENADLEFWILGSSAGPSSRAAGELGLPFAGNYHVSPSTVLESVQSYREAFRPSKLLDRPYVMVSADVVVADDTGTAHELALPYAQWVLDIRTGEGAKPYATPAQAASRTWTDEERALVGDRVATQFVGTPEIVAEKLRVLQKATGADELLITTITHDFTARLRSHDLLAQAWNQATR
jgi:alkanesulfonate monooxygenase SsuD/methylene tetrahydromethanopterin reductase-like flavin-dependent oxidoreductase (luciferase family)